MFALRGGRRVGNFVRIFFDTQIFCASRHPPRPPRMSGSRPIPPRGSPRGIPGWSRGVLGGGPGEGPGRLWGGGRGGRSLAGPGGIWGGPFPGPTCLEARGLGGLGCLCVVLRVVLCVVCCVVVLWFVLCVVLCAVLCCVKDRCYQIVLGL